MFIIIIIIITCPTQFKCYVALNKIIHLMQYTCCLPYMLMRECMLGKARTSTGFEDTPQLNNMYSVFHQWYSNLATFTLNGFAWFDLPRITKGEGVVGGGLMLPMVFYDSSKLGYFMVCSLKQNSRFPVTPSPTKKVPFPFAKPITKGTILTLSYGPTTYPKKDHLNHQGKTSD